MGTDGFAPPLPERTPTSAPFWEALDRGELCLQRCTSCGAWVHYPRSRCSSCLSDALVWEVVEPVGVIHAFTVARRPTAPMFADAVPQVIAIVELPIGVRLTTTVVVDDPGGLSIGLPVVGVFDRVDGGTTLLRFRPAD